MNIDFRGAVHASAAIAVADGVAVSDSVAVDFQGRTCCERVKGGLAEAASQRSRSLSTETIKKWINVKKFGDYPRFTADITPGATAAAAGLRRRVRPGTGGNRFRARRSPAAPSSTRSPPAPGRLEPRKNGDVGSSTPAWHREQKQSIGVNPASRLSDTRLRAA